MDHRRILEEIRRSGLALSVACKASGISRSTYYRWLRGRSGLKPGRRRSSWNALSPAERAEILLASDAHPEWKSRQIAYHLTDRASWSVSESSVCRVLKAAGRIMPGQEEHCRAERQYWDKPQRVHDQWQTDFTDFLVRSWANRCRPGRTPWPRASPRRQ